jgi:hypothetical protein
MFKDEAGVSEAGIMSFRNSYARAGKILKLLSNQDTYIDSQ